MAPYVRTHGNQIALVHGARDKASGKVQQRILFKLYSKIEAKAAIGEHENPQHARYFRQIIEGANPDLKFDWDDLGKQIQQKMEELPDIYPVQRERSANMFRAAMDDFVKQLVVADPSQTKAAKETLDEIANDLKTVRSLIEHRLTSAALANRPNQTSPFGDHDPFCWRNEIQGNDVPPDIEGLSIALKEAHRFEEAKQLLSLLIRCFPDYAEGFNRLGIIKLAEGEPKEAVELFKTTVKVSRNRFPRRIPKSNYWLDIETRPFIRGLMNLALALNQAEKYKETLEVCDRLEKECGDAGKVSAIVHRAAAYLNLSRWQEAYDQAISVIDESADEGFVAGFAAFELGRKQEALELFLYATAHSPHSAGMLIDAPVGKPESHSEVDDHNAGIELSSSLRRFFHKQPVSSQKFFKRLKDNASMKSFVKEVIECTRAHSNLRGEGHRRNFDRWQQLKTRKNAKLLARKIVDELLA